MVYISTNIYFLRVVHFDPDNYVGIVTPLLNTTLIIGMPTVFKYTRYKIQDILFTNHGAHFHKIKRQQYDR